MRDVEMCGSEKGGRRAHRGKRETERGLCDVTSII